MDTNYPTSPPVRRQAPPDSIERPTSVNPLTFGYHHPSRRISCFANRSTRQHYIIEQFEPGDGAPWMDLAHEWDRFGPQMIEAFLTPFPPLEAAGRLAISARLDLWDLARRLILPVRTMASELFDGEMASLLLAGNASHAGVTPEAAPSGFLGQTVGFPVPVGGGGSSPPR